MDKIYDCLEAEKLFEICKVLGSARNAIFISNGISVVSSDQYQDLIHVLHDVEKILSERLVSECKKLENNFIINKV